MTIILGNNSLNKIFLLKEQDARYIYIYFFKIIAMLSSNTLFKWVPFNKRSFIEVFFFLTFYLVFYPLSCWEKDKSSLRKKILFQFNCVFEKNYMFYGLIN